MPGLESQENTRRDEERVDIPAKGFPHLSPAHIGNGMQRQTVVEFIVTSQILPYAVDNEMEKLMLLVKKQGHGQVANLLLGVLGRGNEIDGFQMTEVDVPAQDVDV